MPTSTVKILDTITALSAEQWNAVSGTANPFTRYEFLSALETCRCTTRRQGWQPQHLAFVDQTGAITALLPNYLKYHSRGEYVFDWGWADAYDRHGLDYYPKLLSAIPFTPSVGPRLLYRGDQAPSGSDALHQEVAAALTALAERQQASSWHLLFARSEAIDAVSRGQGVLTRLGVQFRWHNRGYASFQAFLDVLVSRKRKMIRKERRTVAEQAIGFRHLQGNEIIPEDLDRFFTFYQATYFKHGQQPYLTREFFHQLRETMPEQMHLVMAEHGGKDVAAALFFVNQDTLFGRYWGCLEEYDRLHFETCYYQGIDLCIARELQEFDAGAQGEHKILRGFEPVITRSCHWIAHPSFRAAIADFVEQEARQIEAYAREAETLLPYRET